MRHSVEDEPEVADGTRERRSPLRFRTRHSAGRRARRACAETPGQSDDAVRSAKAGSETIPISEPTPSLARRRTYPRNRAQENVNAPRRRPTFRPIDESNAAGVARARQFYRPRRCFTPNMNGQVQSSRERLGFGAVNLGLFSGMIATDRIPTIQSFNSDAELDDTMAATEVDSKVKTKLLSMWNNVKYGWTVKMKTNFSKESPVWLLGQCYLKKSEYPLERASEALEPVGTGSQVSLAMDAANFENTIEEFKRDFVSRLWLTYRREFPILNGSTFTTDCGWGCMLRSGQMMLAQALVCHFLGREWRWRPEQSTDESSHRMIIKWFGDQPTPESPFSIHRLVSLGALTGKRAGDWYGPSSVAHLLCQAMERASEDPDSKLNQLAVYVAQDCAVYMQDVENICCTPDGKRKALILLVPLRLGADKLNPIYAPCLTSLLTLDTCIGVIGGRPRHSLYFIGYQDDKLIHLDPHYCQETVDVEGNEKFPLTSFHCTSPRKMLLSKMDPSCCVGFYFPDKESLTDFMETIQRFVIPNQKIEYPMFLFCEGSGKDLQQGIEVVEDLLPSASQFVGHENGEDDLYECEEFELLQ